MFRLTRTLLLITAVLTSAALLPAAPAAEATRDAAGAGRHPPSLEGARFAPVAIGASATLR